MVGLDPIIHMDGRVVLDVAQLVLTAPINALAGTVALATRASSCGAAAASRRCVTCEFAA